MCSGKAEDGDICKSSQVLSVGKIEFEKGKEKTCRELCEELKSEYGIRERYCGKEYAINFTFKEDVEYVANHSVDRLNPQTYVGRCGLLKSGWQTDLSCYGNIEELTDCACLNCWTHAPPVVVIADVFVPPFCSGRSVRPEGRIFLKEDCGELETLPASITLNKISDHIKCELFPSSEMAARCIFEKGTKVNIWSKDVGTTDNYCYSLLGTRCGCPPFGWCGGLQGFGCTCFAIGVCETS